MYICAELVDGACTTWVEYSALIPPLSVAQGLKLGFAVLACYATAWGLNLLIRFLLSHQRY